MLAPAAYKQAYVPVCAFIDLSSFLTELCWPELLFLFCFIFHFSIGAASCFGNSISSLIVHRAGRKLFIVSFEGQIVIEQSASKPVLYVKLRSKSFSH